MHANLMFLNEFDVWTIFLPDEETEDEALKFRK